MLCKEAGGVQDQIAAAYGGFNRIRFSESGYCVDPIIVSPERKRWLNDNLLLFFTGISRFSSDIQVDTQKSLKDKTTRLLEMLSLVDEAERILTSDCDLEEFGRLLHYTWTLKRGISSGISTTSIDVLYGTARSAGAVGGKLLGAGGGGFFLFYVEKEKQKAVIEALSDLLYVPFSFEDKGTRIIHYSPENYVPAGKE